MSEYQHPYKGEPLCIILDPMTDEVTDKVKELIEKFSPTVEWDKLELIEHEGITYIYK